MFIRKFLFVIMVLSAGAAQAQTVTLTDPTGDDNGPGAYIYPTDAVYSPGSFDLTELEVTKKGKNIAFTVSVNQRLEDPWGMDVGFAVQMIFIFIDTDGQEGSGHTEGLPGLNVQFAPGDAWDKVSDCFRRSRSPALWPRSAQRRRPWQPTLLFRGVRPAVASRSAAR